MRTIQNFIEKYKLLIFFIALGIFIRLISALAFNHMFDFRNILSLMKSVADTGNLTDGFFVLKRQGLEVQLYGKIYYQLGALWLWFLHFIKILDINYLFDVKPFDKSYSYMVGLGQWNPPLYQLVAIKLSQFFYDFLFLYFFYKSAQILEIRNKSLVVLFWAINPYIIFTAYAMFQSDLAMLSFFMGGIYFTLKVLKNDSSNTGRDKILSLIFYSIGAVIKQLPILIIPFVIVLYSKRISSFLFYCLVFILSYIIVSQPWSSDAELIRLFFLTSKESMALFNFVLNNVPIFFILYLSLFGFVLLGHKERFNIPFNFLLLVTIILSCVYISEDNSFFFPQFNVWIMPFIILIALVKNEYAIFLLAPVIGFIKRSMLDNDFFSGSLSETFGSLFSTMPKYEQILKSSFNSHLIDWMLNSIMVFLYLFFIYLLLSEIRIFPSIKERYNYITLFLKKYYLQILSISLLSYYVFLGLDSAFKSRYVTFRGREQQEVVQDVHLNAESISMQIKNPNRHIINALELRTSRKDVKSKDNVVFTFTDLDTGKKLLEQKVFDYYFPLDAGPTFIFLKKGLSAKNMKLEISKESTQNDIVVYKAKFISPPQEFLPGRIELVFKKDPILIQLRGQHPIMHIIYSFGRQVFNKPTFFISYLILLLLNSGVLLYLFMKINRSSQRA